MDQPIHRKRRRWSRRIGKKEERSGDHRRINLKFNWRWRQRRFGDETVHLWRLFLFFHFIPLFHCFSDCSTGTAEVFNLCLRSSNCNDFRHLHWNVVVHSSEQFRLFDRLLEFAFLKLRCDVHADETNHGLLFHFCIGCSARPLRISVVLILKLGTSLKAGQIFLCSESCPFRKILSWSWPFRKVRLTGLTIFRNIRSAF